MATIIVKQSGKAARSMEVSDNRQLGAFLSEDLLVQPTGKTITVNGASVSMTYNLQDGDRLHISQNNAGADA